MAKSHFTIATPILLVSLIGLTLWQALEPTGIAGANGPEWWRLMTFPFFLGEPGQAVLSLLTLALVSPGIEQQRGGPIGLILRWLLASLVLGACQRFGPPTTVTGPTLIGLAFLTETALVSYGQKLSPWKTWAVLLIANVGSALFQGWIFPSVILSLFVGAVFAVISQRFATSPDC